MSARLMNRSVLSMLATIILPAIVANGPGTLHAGINVWTTHGPQIAYVPDVRTVIFDPQDSNALYASTSGGIFKSGNGGADWAPLWPVTFLSSNPFLLAAALPYETQSSSKTAGSGGSDQPSTLYAASTNGLFKSTDGGANWVRLALPVSYLVPSALQVDPRNANTIFIVHSRDRNGSDLYRSRTAG